MFEKIKKEKWSKMEASSFDRKKITESDLFTYFLTNLGPIPEEQRMYIRNSLVLGDSNR